jgi:hypothetical protein
MEYRLYSYYYSPKDICILNLGTKEQKKQGKNYPQIIMRGTKLSIHPSPTLASLHSTPMYINCPHQSLPSSLL